MDERNWRSHAKALDIARRLAALSANGQYPAIGSKVIGAEQLASAGDWRIGDAFASFVTLLIRLDGTKRERRNYPLAPRDFLYQAASITT